MRSPARRAHLHEEELVSDPHIEDALHDLAEANADDFAAAHPADPDVRYFAWAGVSHNADLLLHPFHPERITQAMPGDCTTSFTFQNRAFQTDLILVAAHDITGHLLSGEPNDGMATVASARGLPGPTFMGCVPADHLGEVGHKLDHRQAGVDRLRSQGLLPLRRRRARRDRAPLTDPSPRSPSRRLRLGDGAPIRRTRRARICVVFSLIRRGTALAKGARVFELKRGGRCVRS